MANKRLIRFDWAMKYILRNKANFDVFEGFLSNLLKEAIKIENILESESNKDAADRKINRVDLMCNDSQGRRIIIEIQNQREVDYLQRVLWGASKTIADDLQAGIEYKQVVKVISISILYFPISQENDYIYKGQTEFTGVHTKRPLQIQVGKAQAMGLNKLSIGDVFPEYYLIDVEKFEDIINEEIDEWVYFFKHGEIREDFKSPGILLASARLDVLAMEPKDRKSYENYLSYLVSERDILGNAKLEGEAIGIAKGFEQGIEQGIVKGIEQGIAKGVEQGFGQGVGQGKSYLIIKQLQKKFKHLPEHYREKLQTLPADQLDSIGEAIFDMERIDELERYF